MNISIEKCPVFNDYRGDLIQFATHTILRDNGLSFGQVYLITFNGRETVRGNHYHHHSTEIFCLVSGTVEMVFEDVASKERARYVLTASQNGFHRIYVGPGIAHAIVCRSDFAIVVSFSSKEFDPNDEDKILYQLV